MTSRHAEHLLRAYLAIRRHGISIKALDPGDRVKLPKPDHECICGCKKPKHAIGKKGDRWVCAGWKCGRPWPMSIAYGSVRGGSRSSVAPGSREREILARVAWGLRRMSERRRVLLCAWNDTRLIPERRYQRRQRLVAEYLRALYPRATVTVEPARVGEAYESALDELARKMRGEAA